MSSCHAILIKHRHVRLLWFILIAALVLLMLAPSAAGGEEPAGHQLRIGYVIPTNRTAQADGPENLRYLACLMQGWYNEQMDRNGFGSMTFDIETEADGVTPVVHIVNAAKTDIVMRGGGAMDLWGNTQNAMIAAGHPMFVPGEAWLIVPETHEQLPDGSVIGDVTLGQNLGTGSGGGIGMTGSSLLSLMTADHLLDTTPYDGMTIPQIGPYPLVYGISYPSFSGSTISSLISTKHGGAMHEFGHALRLPHDARNDTNFHGNLMFNGFRGIRGSLTPDLFTQEDSRLAYASALTLSQLRYFNPDTAYSEDNAPTVSIQTSGVVDPVNGLLRISFTASDDTELAAATLRRGFGAAFAEMTLAGTSATHTFETPYYEPGSAVDFWVSVYDTQGNWANTKVSITPNSGFNRAPQPSIKVFNSLTRVGDHVLLDASASNDPDGNNSLMTVEWDLDGDGVFDTPATTDMTYLAAMSTIGTRLIYARLTDTLGDSSISTPLSLRVLLDGDLNDDGFVGVEDLNVVLANWNKQVIFGDHASGDPTWDGFVGINDLNVVLANWNNTEPPTAVAPSPGTLGLMTAGLLVLIPWGRRHRDHSDRRSTQLDHRLPRQKWRHRAAQRICDGTQ
jgi:hypothetical protein